MNNLNQKICLEDDLIEEQREAFLSNDFRRFRELSDFTGIDYPTSDEEQEIGPEMNYENNDLFGSISESSFVPEKKCSPSKSLILTLFNSNPISLNNIYTSLDTLNFGEYFSYLNLDEFLISAKEIGYLKHKNKGMNKSLNLWNQDIYTIFHQLFEGGFPLYNGVKGLTESQRNHYKSMNPYSHNSFKDRINSIPEKTNEKFKELLKKELPSYITERNYYLNPQPHKNSGDIILYGAPAYRRNDSRGDRSKKWANYYAREISKKLKTYNE